MISIPRFVEARMEGLSLEGLIDLPETTQAASWFRRGGLAARRWSGRMAGGAGAARREGHHAHAAS